MTLIKDFLSAIDAKWKPVGTEPITLKLIGSGALMLQCEYERGTKDGDILETKEVSPIVQQQLLSLASKKTDLYNQFRIYIDFVNVAILFTPQSMVFHPITDLPLKNFSVEVLDIVDVVVSKLKRFNQNDSDDVRAMIARNLVLHSRLIERFKAAVDMFSTDGRAEDLHKYTANLHRVERDMFHVPESQINPPDWMTD